MGVEGIKKSEVKNDKVIFLSNMAQLYPRAYSTSAWVLGHLESGPPRDRCRTFFNERTLSSRCLVYGAITR